VIRKIAGRVLDHPHADIAESPRPPLRHTMLAGVFGALNFGPVRRAEGNLRQLHRQSSGFGDRAARCHLVDCLRQDLRELLPQLIDGNACFCRVLLQRIRTERLLHLVG
jgi:hypothetical protein